MEKEVIDYESLTPFEKCLVDQCRAKGMSDEEIAEWLEEI